jgi:hypothetical protein
MTEKAKEARRLYYREWRKKNPEKEREYHRRYWDKKAQAEAQGERGADNGEAD